jgi:hypothetical protein
MHGGDQPLTVFFRDRQGKIEGKRELFPILFSIQATEDVVIKSRFGMPRNARARQIPRDIGSAP